MCGCSRNKPRKSSRKANSPGIPSPPRSCDQTTKSVEPGLYSQRMTRLERNSWKLKVWVGEAVVGGAVAGLVDVEFFGLGIVADLSVRVGVEPVVEQIGLRGGNVLERRVIARGNERLSVVLHRKVRGNAVVQANRNADGRLVEATEDIALLRTKVLRIDVLKLLLITLHEGFD